jgi:hypothetical protein
MSLVPIAHRLRSLYCSKLLNLTTGSIQIFVEGAFSLTDLDLTSCKDAVSDGVITTVAECCTGLRRLKIEGCVQVCRLSVCYWCVDLVCLLLLCRLSVCYWCVNEASSTTCSTVLLLTRPAACSYRPTLSSRSPRSQSASPISTSLFATGSPIPPSAPYAAPPLAPCCA